MLTIFTPTYNRADLLPVLYESLIRQTNYEFEWLVVDDESTDNTENVIREIIKKENPFQIRFYKKKHGGKHRAINYALDVACGEYFFIVDSDDYLKDNAVELIIQWIGAIDAESQIAGVAGLKVLPNGKPTSGNPKFDEKIYIDASNFERSKYNLQGDQAEIYKTCILKEHKFPDYEGENFLEEAVVWNRLAELGYIVRWYAIPIYCCDYLEGGLTRTRNRWRILDNFYGYSEHYRLLIHYGTREERDNAIFYFWWASCKKKLNLTDKCKLVQMTKLQYLSALIRVLPVYGFKNIKTVIEKWKK